MRERAATAAVKSNVPADVPPLTGGEIKGAAKFTIPPIKAHPRRARPPDGVPARPACLPLICTPPHHDLQQPQVYRDPDRWRFGQHLPL